MSDTIKNMYNFQLNELNSPFYKKYLDYIKIFYRKKAGTKNNIYDKNYQNSKYILIDKKDKKKTITITPSEFINIYEYYFTTQKQCNKILYNISLIIESKNNINDENRESFDILKKEYISLKKKINDIQLIQDEFYKSLNELLNKKINESNNIIKFYQKRRNYYHEIKTMIPEEIKREFITIFKKNKNKMPEQTEINQISKKYKIPAKDTENWFLWIESSYYYLIAKKEINKLDKEMIEKEDTFDFHSKYMIIKKPIIK
jgi:hypothetical protein